MSFEVTKLLGRHNSTSIPKDQQKLLDRHGVGAVGGWSHRPSLDDVPSHVLSTVTDAYVESKKRDANTARLPSDVHPFKSTKISHNHNGVGTGSRQVSHSNSEVTPSRSRSPNTTQNPRPNGSHDVIGQSTPKRRADSSMLASSPERFTSWSPSEKGEEEIENALPSSQSKELPHPSHDTAEEHMAPPPKPAAFTRLAPTFDFPSSGPEEDLEVELPAAQLPSQTWAHRTIVPESSIRTPKSWHPPVLETPTCAQPSQTVIPGTVIHDPSLPRQVEQVQPRPRRMKPIEFSDSGDDSPTAQPANVLTSFQRMASTRTYQEINSSNTTASSSIVAASLRQSDTPGLDVSPSAEAVPLATEVGEEPPENDDCNGVVLEDTNFQEQHSAPEIRHDGNDQVLASVEHEGPDQPTHTPFETFSQVYPSYVTKYSGTLLSFVKACICLKYMSKHRSLNHFLWDDFIRAFSAEYLGYVQHTPRPLVASEWYNDREEPPLFQERVVQKGNLDLILQLYPNEVMKAKRNITADNDDHEITPPKTATIHPPTSRSSDKSGGITALLDQKQEVSIWQTQTFKPRATSRPTPQSGPTHTNDNMEVETPSNRPSRERHARRSLASRAVDHLAGTPRHSGVQVTKVPDSTPKSSPGVSKPISQLKYLKGLGKPRTAKEQEKLREHMRRPSSGARTMGPK